MPTERLSLVTLALFAMIMSGGQANAFEPGAETSCRPSADGKDFICEAADGSTPSKKTRAPALPGRVRREPVAVAVADTPVATAAPTISASDLPDYLRHAPEPTVVRRPARGASREAAAAPQPVAEPAKANSDLFTPPPAAVPHQNAVNAAPVAEPAAAPASERPVRRAAQAIADTPAPTSPPASAASVAAPVAAVSKATEPPPIEAEPPAPATATTADRGVPPDALASMTQFRQLPAQHYTLEVGKARSRMALQAQIDSFATVAAPLYLLQLTTPDGDWYVLVLSDFPTTEAARAARSRLPATAAITSGFARRIGPLQAELAR